jgi:hypothetical protein
MPDIIDFEDDELVDVGTPTDEQGALDPGAEQDDDPGRGAPGGDDEDDGDERESARANARLRAERKAKKDKERENGRLRRELEAANSRLAALEEKITGLTSLELQRAADQARSRVTAAEKALRDAMDDGDSERIIEAQRKLRTVEQEAEHVDTLVREGSQQKQPAHRAATGSGNPHLDSWLSENDWFDPQQADADSAVAASLSKAIHAQGIEPTDPKHFKELNRRLAAALPHRFKGKPVDDDDSQPAPRQRSFAPTAGATRSSGGEGEGPGPNRIPKALIEGFRSQGIDWDTPEGRKIITSRWRERLAKTGRLS